MNHSETKKLVVTTGVPSANVFAERISLVNEAGQQISTKTDAELNSRYVVPANALPTRGVVFDGDSITLGTGASNAVRRFSTVAAEVSGSFYVTEVANVGVAGEASAAILSRVAATVATSGCTHVHLACGTNDAGAGVTVTAYMANIAAYVTAVRAAGKSISLSNVPPRASGATAAIHKLNSDYNLALSFYCAANNVPLGDAHGAVVDASGYLASANDSGDGVHPSNAGHLAIAQVVGPVITAAQRPRVWPVKSANTAGLISNSLMPNTTGWGDQGGTGTMTVTANVSGTGSDGLLAGAWLKCTIDNSASGSGVYRERGAVLDNTKYSAGDVLLVFGQVKQTAVTTGTVKFQITNNATTSGIFFDSTNQGLATPGPICKKYTVPASPGTLRLSFVVSALANQLIDGYLGCAQVFNATTGGFVGYV